LAEGPVGAFDDLAALPVIEAAGNVVALDAPQMHRGARRNPGNPFAGSLEQLVADPGAFRFGADVQVIEPRTPLGLLIEQYAGEAEEPVVGDGFQYDPAVGGSARETRAPESTALGHDLPVEELVGEDPAICGAPALRVQPCNRVGVLGARRSQGDRAHFRSILLRTRLPISSCLCRFRAVGFVIQI
jgi:hypothetical protein